MNIPEQHHDTNATATPTAAGWDALAADWLAQPTAAVDAEALRRDVSRRSRHIRGWLALEILLTMVATGMCAWATFGVDPPLFSQLQLAVLVALMLGFQGWSLWIRRRQIRDSGLDVRALLALERDRIDTSLHYWRVNAWVMVALWVGLVALLMAAVTAGADEPWMTPRQAALAMALNAPLVIAMAVFAWWWCRRNRARRGRVAALQAELDAE